MKGRFQGSVGMAWEGAGNGRWLPGAGSRFLKRSHLAFEMPHPPGNLVQPSALAG